MLVYQGLKYLLKLAYKTQHLDSIGLSKYVLAQLIYDKLLVGN